MNAKGKGLWADYDQNAEEKGSRCSSILLIADHSIMEEVLYWQDVRSESNLGQGQTEIDLADPKNKISQESISDSDML